MKLTRDKKKYELIDAKEQVWFDVTPNCITKAAKLKKTSCVVARAMGEAWPEANRIEVGASVVVVFLGKIALRYKTTEKLKEAINKFDETGKWELGVGQYHLLPPTGRRQLGKRIDQHTANGKKNTATRAQRPYNVGTRVLKPLNPRFVEFRKEINAAAQ